MKTIVKTYALAAAILTLASVSYLTASPRHNAAPSPAASCCDDPPPCGILGLPPCPNGRAAR